VRSFCTQVTFIGLKLIRYRTVPSVLWTSIAGIVSWRQLTAVNLFVTGAAIHCRGWFYCAQNSMTLRLHGLQWRHCVARRASNEHNWSTVMTTMNAACARPRVNVVDQTWRTTTEFCDAERRWCPTIERAYSIPCRSTQSSVIVVCGRPYMVDQVRVTCQKRDF